VVVDSQWGRRLAVSSLLALAAFVVFAALPQRTFHGFDTDYYAALLAAGEFEPVRTHVAYLPICAAVHAALRPFGTGAVDAMLVASALGSAAGVWFLHRAGLRLVRERAAAWLPIAVAVTPACFYFATAAEVHGVFAAGSGGAWLAFARWRDSGSMRAAAVLGAVCGLAASIHTAGHLLSPMFVAVAVLQRVQPPRALAGAVAAIAAGHALAAIAVLWLVGTGASAHGGAAVGMVTTWSASADLSLAGEALWREGIAPYLPWSALAFVGLFVRTSRPWALAWLAAFALHAPLACLFLAREGAAFHERGAYLLPVAVPAVLAAGLLLPRRWPWAAVAASAVLAIAITAPRWPARYDERFVEAVARLREERDVAFVVGPAELEGVRARVPGTVGAEIERSLAAYFGITASDAAAPPLPAWFDAMLGALGFPQRECVLTADACARIERSPSPAVQGLWRHLQTAYTLEPLHRTGLDAVLLRRR
jgi:hypothetical protein